MLGMLSHTIIKPVICTDILFSRIVIVLLAMTLHIAEHTVHE